MKKKILENGTENYNHPKHMNEPKRKFAFLPTIAIDCEYNLGTYIVWLEWVTWCKSYKRWKITK